MKYIIALLLLSLPLQATDYPHADNCVDRYIDRALKGGPNIAWQCHNCRQWNRAIYRYCQNCGAKH